MSAAHLSSGSTNTSTRSCSGGVIVGVGRQTETTGVVEEAQTRHAGVLLLAYQRRNGWRSLMPSLSAERWPQGMVCDDKYYTTK